MATEGPLFVTWTVYVTGIPATAPCGATLSDLTIDMSAVGTSVSESTGLLSVRSGSVTVGGTVTDTEFVRVPVAAG